MIIQVSQPQSSAPGIQGMFGQETRGVTAAPIEVDGTTTLLAAPGANKRMFVNHFSAMNSHATQGAWATLRSGAAGPLLARAYLAAAGGGISATFPSPLRLQTNTAVALEIETDVDACYVHANVAGFIVNE